MSGAEHTHVLLRVRCAAAVVTAMLSLSVPAFAADVEGTVHLQRADAADGGTLEPQPVVVYLTGFRQPPPNDSPVIAQRNKTFVPNLRVIVAGQTLRFTNDDQVVHNVFSTSKARPFDLGKPGPGQTRDVKFSTPGLVDIDCNIHETMWASVLVLPNNAFSIVDETGHFLIHGVPSGTYPLHAWGHQIAPYEMQITVDETKPTHVDISPAVRAFNPAHLDKFGRPYRVSAGYPP